MPDPTAERISKVGYLRQKVQRFRQLASGVDDKKAIETIDAMSREAEEEAAQIEQEIAQDKTLVSADDRRSGR
jgi:hypothetical protein